MTSYSQKLGGLPVTLFTNQHANGVDMAKRTHTQMLSERACKSFRTCETKVPEPLILFNTTIFYKFHCLTFKLHQPLFASPSNFLCLPSPQFPPLPPPPITSRHILILFLESETPVDICMIHLYMHVMATANDNVLKSHVQVKCQCMQLFTLIYMGCGLGQIHSPRLNHWSLTFWLLRLNCKL